MQELHDTHGEHDPMLDHPKCKAYCGKSMGRLQKDIGDLDKMSKAEYPDVFGKSEEPPADEEPADDESDLETKGGDDDDDADVMQEKALLQLRRTIRTESAAAVRPLFKSLAREIVAAIRTPQTAVPAKVVKKSVETVKPTANGHADDATVKRLDALEKQLSRIVAQATGRA